MNGSTNEWVIEKCPISSIGKLLTEIEWLEECPITFIYDVIEISLTRKVSYNLYPPVCIIHDINDIIFSLDRNPLSLDGDFFAQYSFA